MRQDCRRLSRHHHRNRARHGNPLRRRHPSRPDTSFFTLFFTLLFTLFFTLFFTPSSSERPTTMA